MPTIQQEALAAAQQYVGQPLTAMVEGCKAAGWTVRVTRRDGQSMIGTCGYRPNRINVAVENEVVTVIGGIG